MKKRGFTLIELLAVIVVLAIIALIATPIVMNVIKNAQMGAAERSADNYVKAVDLLISTNKLDGNKVEDGTYTIDTNGNLTFGSVEVSGTKPVGGKIEIKNGQVVKDSSTVNYKDYTVTFENGVAKAEGGESKKLMTLADCDYVSGTKAEGEVGAKYTCNFGDKDRTFYILETSEQKASNSTLKENKVALILEGNYDTTTHTWCDQEGKNPNDTVCGADGLAAKLDDIVENSWSKLDRSQIGIPSAEQLFLADGQAEDAYLDNPILSSKWLLDWDNTAWGDTIYGYWTSTHTASDFALAVYSGGNVLDDDVDIDNGYGVRPVIMLEV